MPDTSQISIRIPPDELDALRRAAAAERRSVNQQICVLVARGLANAGYLPPADGRFAAPATRGVPSEATNRANKPS